MTEVSAGTLTDFLLRRIADDEADARAAGGTTWRVDAQGCCVVEAEGDGWMDNIETHHNGTAPHIARHDPARVLAECEAKRQIIARCDDSRRPHHFPTPMPDAELIAWKCAACDRWVSEGSAGDDDCPVDWRPPQPILALLALPYAGHAEFNPAWRL